MMRLARISPNRRKIAKWFTFCFLQLRPVVDDGRNGEMLRPSEKRGGLSPIRQEILILGPGRLAKAAWVSILRTMPSRSPSSSQLTGFSIVAERKRREGAENFS